MEISYKYIVLVLVILAIVCVIMTVECFSSNNDEENKNFIEEKIIEKMEENNESATYVSADSIIRNLTTEDELEILQTPRLQLGTKFLSFLKASQLQQMLFTDLEMSELNDSNVQGMIYNEDTNGKLSSKTVGEFLENAGILDMHLQDVINNVLNSYNLTGEQSGQLYNIAKHQLKDLMKNDVSEYHEAIKFAGEDGYDQNQVVIPGISEFITNLVGESRATAGAQVNSSNDDSGTLVSSTFQVDPEVHYTKPILISSEEIEEQGLQLENVMNMLTNNGTNNMMTLDTTSLDIEGLPSEVNLPLSEDQGLPTELEISNAIKDFVILLSTESGENVSTALPNELRRRVRYNRNYVFNAIANILNSRAMKKDWDWKKSVVNGVIVKRTNISPNIISSTPLSKIARILNADEEKTLLDSYPNKYKFLRARGIINSLNVTPGSKDLIFNTIFNKDNIEYHTLEETLQLPLTTSLHVLAPGQDASNRPAEVIIDTVENDPYAQQKVETLLTHTTIEGIYETSPARFVRRDMTVDENGQFSRSQCNLGLPLYVFDHKPTASGESSLKRKIGRGILNLDTNMITDSYVNGQNPKGEMVNNEVIYITNEDYISTDENTPGLILSNRENKVAGDFKWEGGENTKQIDADRVTYIKCEIVTDENSNTVRNYNLIIGDNALEFTTTNLQNWTVIPLKEKFSYAEPGSNLRFEIAMINEFINTEGVLEEKESNFQLNDLHLFPIVYRDPYPLDPIEDISELTRRTLAYPEPYMITENVQQIQIHGLYNVSESFNVLSESKRKSRDLLRMIEGYSDTMIYGPDGANVKLNATFFVELERNMNFEPVAKREILLKEGDTTIETISAEDVKINYFRNKLLFKFTQLTNATTYTIEIPQGTFRINDVNSQNSEEPVEMEELIWNFMTVDSISEEDQILNWPQNKKEVLAVYRIIAEVIDIDSEGNEVRTPSYQRDQNSLLQMSGSDLNGIDITSTGVDPFMPILKCPEPPAVEDGIYDGIGQSVLFGENGDLLVQVVRKASDSDSRGQMEKDSNGNIIDHNVHRTYIDATGLNYNIEADVDITQPIGWKTQELRDLFKYYESIYNSEISTTDLQKLQVRANMYDLVLINKLIVSIANSKLTIKRSKLDLMPRNTLSFVLDTEIRLHGDSVENWNGTSEEDKGVTETLYEKISDSLSNFQICKSGGSSEISVDALKGMGLANFKSIFESAVIHMESLNIRNASKVFISTDNLGVTILDSEGNLVYPTNADASQKTLTRIDGENVCFLTHTDVNRLMKSIYGSFSGYKDTDDLQSDTFFALVKIWDILFDTPAEIASWVGAKWTEDNDRNRIIQGLNRIVTALNELCSNNNSEGVDKSHKTRWSIDSFHEPTWLETNLYTERSDELNFVDVNDLHNFLGDVYEKITLSEFFSTRMYTIGIIPQVDNLVDVTTHIQNLRANITATGVARAEKMADVAELENRFVGNMDPIRINRVADSINMNIMKRYHLNTQEKQERFTTRVTADTQFGTIRQLLTGVIENQSLREQLSLIEPFTNLSLDNKNIIKNVNINRENFSPLDNRPKRVVSKSSKNQVKETMKNVESDLLGNSNDDKYFSLDNSYSLL